MEDMDTEELFASKSVLKSEFTNQDNSPPFREEGGDTLNQKNSKDGANSNDTEPKKTDGVSIWFTSQRRQKNYCHNHRAGISAGRRKMWGRSPG